jgi:hypothetical protein
MPSISRSRFVRVATALAGTVAATALVAPSALASNHLVKLREVFAGSSTHPGDEYVEVQMYASGENMMANAVSVNFYDAAGTQTYSFAPMTADGNPPNGQSQRRVLFATASAQTDFSKSAGYSLAAGDHVNNAGGAVCYVSGTPGFVDCVSWGNFSGSLPSMTGGDVDPTGIPDGQAIRRSIAGGCPTLLEASDDTDTPADWSNVAPDPMNNADTPPEHPCVNTTITKGPKAKTTDRTPTFKFQSTQSPATFKCKLDTKPFKSCTSPDTLRRLKLGRHTFKVRATSGGFTDPTPAKKTFKVVKRHR